MIKFRRVKTEHRYIAEVANAFVVNLDAERMSRIINHAQAVTVGNLLNLSNVAGRPEHVHRQNRGRVRRYHRLNLRGVNVHRRGVNIAENRRDIIPTQNVRRCGKSKRRRDNFAAQSQTLTRNH